MAIKVGGTEVVDNNRQLKNIASVDATTVAALGTAGVGGGPYEVISDTMHTNVSWVDISIIQDAFIKLEFTKFQNSTGSSPYFNFYQANSGLQQVKYGIWRMHYGTTSLQQSSSSWTSEGRISVYQFNTGTGRMLHGYATYYKETNGQLRMNGQFYNDDNNDPALEHFAMNTGTNTDLSFMRFRTTSGTFSTNIRVLRET